MGIKIKNIKLSERCEVCHKSDEFDQVKEFCGRCSHLVIEKMSDYTLLTIKNYRFFCNFWLILSYSVTSIFVGCGCVCLFYSVNHVFFGYLMDLSECRFKIVFPLLASVLMFVFSFLVKVVFRQLEPIRPAEERSFLDGM
jgi:hypothetical protein